MKTLINQIDQLDPNMAIFSLHSLLWKLTVELYLLDAAIIDLSPFY